MMFRRIDQYVNKYHMVKEGDAVLIGLSGGADSVCLARYLLTLRESLSVRLYALHVNHMLREQESEGDQRFVEDFCRKWDIPLTVVREDVISYAGKRKISVEEAGREIRYEQFHRLADKMECNAIAVAHHRGDQAETILFRLIRGTGVRGLKGMEPVNGKVIRPLLPVGREDILAILSSLGQDYREDSSNAVTDYHRNCIRHVILPEMTRMNAGAQEHIARLSERVLEIEEFLLPLIENAFEKYTGISVGERCPSGIMIREDLSEAPDFIRREVFREAMASVAGRKKDISSVHVDSLEELLTNKAGKMVYLPYDMKALRQPSGLAIYRNETCNKEIQDKLNRDQENQDQGKDVFQRIPFPLAAGRPVTVKAPGLTIRTGRIEKERLSSIKHIKKDEGHCLVLLDYDRINADLCIRTRRPGDYFIMDSQEHRKLLKRYFIDEKIPPAQRETMLLLAADSHILWMEKGRVSETLKVTEETKNILFLEIRKETKNER